MSSDGRYMYQHPPPMETYEYQPYPSTSYDTAHYPPPSARHARPNGSHSHSPAPPPAQAAYAPPPSSSYPSPYMPPQYGLPPPQWTAQQQWAYPVHSPYAPPPPPQAQPVYSSPPARPDVLSDPATHAPVMHRGIYAAPPEPVRGVASSSLIPDPAPRGRDTPVQNRDTMVTTPPLDFTKLLDSMRTILEGSRSFSGAALPPQLEPAHQQTLESMLQHATFGYEMLDFASVQAVSPPIQQREERVMLEAQEEVKTTAKLPESTHPDGQTCLGCKATSTPEWRRGPMGPRTLCNACGLVYAKMIKKRGRERAGGAPISSATGDDSASAASEDGETYTTQARRNQAGERR